MLFDVGHVGKPVAAAKEVDAAAQMVADITGGKIIAGHGGLALAHVAGAAVQLPRGDAPMQLACSWTGAAQNSSCAEPPHT